MFCLVAEKKKKKKRNKRKKTNSEAYTAKLSQYNLLCFYIVFTFYLFIPYVFPAWIAFCLGEIYGGYAIEKLCFSLIGSSNCNSRLNSVELTLGFINHGMWGFFGVWLWFLGINIRNMGGLSIKATPNKLKTFLWCLMCIFSHRLLLRVIANTLFG